MSTDKFNPSSLVKTFNKFGVTVRLYHLSTDETHKTFGYELRVKGRVIFSGRDFRTPKFYHVASIHNVWELLHFLTLRPGDTDPEYFENYTDEQNAFIESDACEELRFYLHTRVNSGRQRQTISEIASL
jgi:hypothetical protein